MNSFSDYLAHGNAWLYIPAAVLLGALHGLEPGHSKTIMAAFIVAIRGTVKQAVLLGLAATVSHGHHLGPRSDWAVLFRAFQRGGTGALF